jgi:hypothetical protein
MDYTSFSVQHLLKDKKHYDGFKGLENRNGRCMKDYDAMTIVDKCSGILSKRVGKGYNGQTK